MSGSEPTDGPERPGDAALGRLVALARETLVLPTTDGIDENTFQRVRSGRRAPVQMRWPVVSALALGALVVAGTPIAWRLVRRPAPLTFEVVHGTIAASGEIRPAAADTRIHFSDGSEIVLGREARTEVRDLADNGGRIVLASGRVDAYFVPRPRAHWQVAAGPYLVQVTGTRFDVAWSDGDQSFELWLRKGSVRVSGPLLPGTVAMKAGQHLVTRGGEGKVLLDDETPTATPAAPAPDEAPPAPAASAVPATARAASLAPAAAVSWSRRIARGDFDAIIAEAQRRGIGAVLERGTRAELGALADAARYTRRGELARRTLLAERTRFADSTEGREAAFFLGTLAEDDAAAARWYARYLRDEPTGTYAAQALGRKLLLEETTSPAAAHDDAQDYLGRFPHGPHADVARRILAR